MGCEFVYGVDMSQHSIIYAEQMNPFDNNEISFVTSSVLDLPFKDNFFDFVFSNGVLHHTYDTQKGLNEIYRVLQNGRSCWLYLYGGKEAFFWDTVDFCRKLLADVPQSYTQMVMKVLGYAPGRIFHRCDFFYVPIQNRYFQSEVEEMISNAGFDNFRRLQRGVSYDWDEILCENPTIDSYIYGEGEMRYILYK
jgi:ubiquinone/menaquinone biosynthesis C-methylase UbiE